MGQILNVVNNIHNFFDEHGGKIFTNFFTTTVLLFVFLNYETIREYGPVPQTTKLAQSVFTY
jgi:hypothetical protein